MKTVELAVTRIGNSRGIRIPADILRHYKLGKSVILEERPSKQTKLSGKETYAEMAKTRPAMVISSDEINAALATIVVCPLTTKLHPHWRSRVQISAGGKPAEIAVDQIRTVSQKRLIRLDKLSNSPPKPRLNFAGRSPRGTAKGGVAFPAARPPNRAIASRAPPSILPPHEIPHPRKNLLCSHPRRVQRRTPYG